LASIDERDPRCDGGADKVGRGERFAAGAAEPGSARVRALVEGVAGVVQDVHLRIAERFEEVRLRRLASAQHLVDVHARRADDGALHGVGLLLGGR